MLLVSIAAALVVWVLVEIYGTVISPDENTPNGENSPAARHDGIGPTSVGEMIVCLRVIVVGTFVYSGTKPNGARCEAWNNSGLNLRMRM